MGKQYEVILEYSLRTSVLVEAADEEAACSEVERLWADSDEFCEACDRTSQVVDFSTTAVEPGQFLSTAAVDARRMQKA